MFWIGSPVSLDYFSPRPRIQRVGVFSGGTYTTLDDPPSRIVDRA